MFILWTYRVNCITSSFQLTNKINPLMRNILYILLCAAMSIENPHHNMFWSYDSQFDIWSECENPKFESRRNEKICNKMHFMPWHSFLTAVHKHKKLTSKISNESWNISEHFIPNIHATISCRLPAQQMRNQNSK